MSGYSLENIVSDLRKLGLEEGDTVLVHCSLKSIGNVDGGADTVIDALIKVLGADGTLLMPSFQKGSEFYLVNKGCVFDIVYSHSEMGIITEIFRSRPGVIRSLNPTHCTAGLGAKASSILSGHEKCRVSVGTESPYHKLIQEKGKILLLGVGHGSNTTLHFIENSNGAPTVCNVLYEPRVIDSNGNEIIVPTYPHMPGLSRNYPRVESFLLEAGLQKDGKVGMASAKLIDTYGMSLLIGGMVRQNPLFLIEPFLQ